MVLFFCVEIATTYFHSSVDDSEVESSMVAMEVVSDEDELMLLLSFSRLMHLFSVRCFKFQYMMLAVSVSIIFWFTW